MSARLIPPRNTFTAPFWDGARKGSLTVQRCVDCGHWLFPPSAHCPACGSKYLSWNPVSGEGVIYTFTVAHRAPHPVLDPLCPLAIAVIQLDEGPRMMSNVIGCDPGELRIGQAVHVAFEPIDDSDVVLPVFRPVDA